MFPFITKTWNPLGGSCWHQCKYCWARNMIKKFNMKKYRGLPELILKEFNKKFKKSDFVFVCDMCDLFAGTVTYDKINEVIDYALKSPAQFLFLTKNPNRYHSFSFGDNAVLGATITSDRKYEGSRAPPNIYRLDEMTLLHHSRKMISIEPIMDFNLERFVLYIAKINPEFVAVGYDNYNNKLNEPSLKKTLKLIELLEKAGIKVYKKTLREPRK